MTTAIIKSDKTRYALGLIESGERPECFLVPTCLVDPSEWSRIARGARIAFESLDYTRGRTPVAERVTVTWSPLDYDQPYEARVTGVHNERGFAFGRMDDDVEDIFLHRKEFMRMSDWDRLCIGDRVRFVDALVDGSRRRARGISLVA